MDKTERDLLLEATESFDKMKELNDTVIKPDNARIDFNEVEVDNIGIIKIKPTKIKYFKSGDYNNFMIIKTIGVVELLKYDDGDTILGKYLTAVFDKEPTQELLDNLTTQNVLDIISVANRLNGIKDDDFLEKMKRMEGMKTV